MVTRSAPVLMRSAPVLIAAAFAQLALFALAVGPIDVLLLIPVVVASSTFGVLVVVWCKSALFERRSLDIGPPPGRQPVLGSVDLQDLADPSGLLPALLSSATSLFTRVSNLLAIRTRAQLSIGSKISRLRPVNTEAAKLADPNRAFRRRYVADHGSANKDPFRVLVQSVSSPRAALTYPVMRRLSCQ